MNDYYFVFRIIKYSLFSMMSYIMYYKIITLIIFHNQIHHIRGRIIPLVPNKLPSNVLINLSNCNYFKWIILNY